MLANSRFRLFLKSMFILIDYFISCNHQVKPNWIITICTHYHPTTLCVRKLKMTMDFRPQTAKETSLYYFKLKRWELLSELLMSFFFLTLPFHFLFQILRGCVHYLKFSKSQFSSKLQNTRSRNILHGHVLPFIFTLFYLWHGEIHRKTRGRIFFIVLKINALEDMCMLISICYVYIFIYR